MGIGLGMSWICICRWFMRYIRTDQHTSRMAAEGYVDIYKTNSQGDVIRRESVSLKV